MILNALDEILFWDNISLLKDFIRQNLISYYPHDYMGYYTAKDAFLKSHLPDRKTFTAQLEKYAQYGAPIWVAGRNQSCDDIDQSKMLKAISVSSRIDNGKQKAAQSSKRINNHPEFWKFYSDSILHAKCNRILELTVGAGGGTNLVMQNMHNEDYYMGVDIDFICAKNADAIATYYNANGLGITTSLWNLPFDNEMFTSVCSCTGLEECREIPTILKEGVRVLETKGRFIVRCLRSEKTTWYTYFTKYGFSHDETLYWLKKIRLFADLEQVKEILNNYGLTLLKQKNNDRLGHILVYEK